MSQGRYKPQGKHFSLYLTPLVPKMTLGGRLLPRAPLNDLCFTLTTRRLLLNQILPWYLLGGNFRNTIKPVVPNFMKTYPRHTKEKSYEH